jgi:hypothetical protein
MQISLRTSQFVSYFKTIIWLGLALVLFCGSFCEPITHKDSFHEDQLESISKSAHKNLYLKTMQSKCEQTVQLFLSKITKCPFYRFAMADSWLTGAQTPLACLVNYHDDRSVRSRFFQSLKLSFRSSQHYPPPFFV